MEELEKEKQVKLRITIMIKTVQEGLIISGNSEQ